ncbi:Maf family protein [Glaciimonas immobilis]|uniref:dTTP/UTP pyrophosphatase n=1 Tax=Glaciimonas immobilis TaxID=728004 RepID=A0A840RU91_9BURK|nr:nucleoside triphosphate pyrophosphatase [Glaciimonas immobilis]KAF3999964.1 septum formation inhibitor Maf [Glaciimonas immobilis]MBB5200466.1 septum formation protein [Glaciimonas immobilis]
MKIWNQKIYLASKSSRRRELLRQIGVDFELLLLRDQAPRGPDVSEAALPHEHPVAYVERVTLEKAAFAFDTMQWRKLPVRPILAADTTVTIDGQILGKPADRAQARDMLLRLSGRTHHVLTSVVVVYQGQSWQITQTSEVVFQTLSENMVRAYCASTEPYDKAGGYGIQGVAALFVKCINGSHSGIMGLPLYETAQLLQQAGIDIL